MVVIGPADWNNLNYLYDLKLPPEDRNIIVTFHYYLPFQFTHQGAEWADGSQAWLGTKWEGSEGSKRAILRDFDLARLWSQQNERPLYLGEFGAYSKADIESRQRWTAFVARSAEEYGFSWAYWEFCAGFGVYDSGLKTWNEPIRRALIP
jgi:endoglucanase